MQKNRTRIAVVVAVVASLALAGCGTKQPKTASVPAPAAIGVIDMDKAIKAHPRYADVVRMQKENAALAASLDAERAQAAGMSGPLGASGLEQAAAKEFEARMAAKEAEVRTQLEAAAEQVRRDLASELDAYAREIDKEYQPKLFNLQLKLRTIQLSKEEAAAVQAEADKLQQERAAKIAARQQELISKADATMKAKQSASEQELAAYARTLNAELAGKIAGQKLEADGGSASGQAGVTETAAKLAAAERDLSALQDAIIGDIRDKAGKVAVRQGLDTVLAGVRVNVRAADITDAVIAEFKK